MNNTINKIYILTRSNTPDKKYIQQKFTNYENVNYWSYKNALKYIDKYNISLSCKILCTNNMIYEWVHNVSLWQYLYVNKMDRILITNNKKIITDKFIEYVNNIWSVVPYNWDIIFFDKYNKFSCYIISFKAMEKIFKSKLFDKIQYDLENNVLLFSKNKLNIITLDNKIITLDNKIITFDNNITSNNVNNTNHALLKPLLNDVGLNIDKEIANINNISITWYIVILILMSFVIGYTNNNLYIHKYLAIIIFLQLIELGFFDITKYKVETLLFELIIVIVFLIIGKCYIKFKGSV